MTPALFKNWLYSIEHQYGQRKCEALACNLLHRSTIINVAALKPADIIDIHRVIDAFDAHYQGEELSMPTFQWLLDFYQMHDYVTYDFSIETDTLLATSNLLKVMLGISTDDDTPAWIHSVFYSISALRYDMRQFMMDTEFFMEHLE